VKSVFELTKCQIILVCGYHFDELFTSTITGIREKPRSFRILFRKKEIYESLTDCIREAKKIK